MERGEGLFPAGTRNGAKLWRARLYWKDQRTSKERERVVVFEAATKAQARIERARHLEAARNGTDPRARDRRRFADVADEWFETIESHGSRLSWGSHLRALKKRYGETWIDMLTRRDLQAYLDALPQSPGTVNSRRDVLKHVCKFAVRKGYCEGNPAAETERRTLRKSRAEAMQDAPRRALTEAEAVALLQWIRKEQHAFYPIAVTQLVLGCRFGEVSALEWSDVDMSTGLVRIAKAQVRGTVGPTKGRYARTAALGPDGLAVLEKHRREMLHEQWPGYERLVFPRPLTTRRKHSEHWSIVTAWHIYKRGLRAIGLDLPVATHLCRHTMLTVAQSFASARLLRAVGGHKSEEMQARYLGTHEAEVVELGTKIGKKLLKGGK